MSLLSSGPIGLSNVRTELGSAQTNFSLSGSQTGQYGIINVASLLRPDGIAPHAMSEWYGYNHSAGYTVSWSHTNNGISLGALAIDIVPPTGSSIPQVFTFSTSNGTFLVPSGWSVAITSNGTPSAGGIGQDCLSIVDNSSTIYSNCAFATGGTAVINYTYTPTGNGTITSNAWENPLTSTLTYVSYDSSFYFTLSNAIPGSSFQIAATAQGYGTNIFVPCGGSIIQNASGTVIFSAGATNATGLGNVDFCLTSVRYKRGTSVTITRPGFSGVAVSNGQTINIVGTTVTLSLSTACSVYVCA